MSRKQARAEAPAPQSAQVDAIERLLDQERFHEAAAKADRLARQFPRHVRLRDLHIRAVASAGDLPRAALLAEAWTREQPNSQRAWSLLFGLGADLGLGYLAHASHQRLVALGADDPQRSQDAQTLIEAIRDKYQGLSDEEGTRSDRGLLYLIGEQLEQAVAELEPCTHPVPRTNLAAACFDLGDMPRAIALAREAWQADAFNTHAARVLARAQLYSGDAEGAAATGAKLRDVLAREPDELAAQLETLDMLEDYAGARRCYESFPGSGFENFRRDMMARMRHAAAVAYFNVGERDRARVLWQQAVEDNRDHPLYQANFSHLLDTESEHTEPAWRELMSEAFPARFARQLQQRVESVGGAQVLLDQPEKLEMLLPGHAHYLGCLLRQTDPLCRRLVRQELANRAALGDAAAEAELRRVLTMEWIGDDERLEALRALCFTGRLPAGSTVTVRLRDALRTLPLNVPAVRAYAPLPGMPEAAQEDYVRSVFAHKPAEVRAALQTLGRWRAQAPEGVARRILDHRQILLLHTLSGREAEGAALLRQCLDAGDALARTHAFAARLAVAHGDLDAAHALLEGQLARAGDNDEDIAPVLTAQIELNAARGDIDAELAARIAFECLGAYQVEQA